LESAGEASEEHSVLDRWNRMHANLCALYKLIYNFGNISILISIIPIDQCIVKCFLEVPWSLISTFIFPICLLKYITQKSYFNLVKGTEI